MQISQDILAKLTPKEKKKFKEFIDKYIDTSFKVDWKGKINLGSGGKRHDQTIANICVWLYHNSIPFATQVRFKNTDYRPDIVCPVRLPNPIIEVRDSETEKRTKSKIPRIPDELLDKITFIDAKKDFDEKQLF